MGKRFRNMPPGLLEDAGWAGASATAKALFSALLLAADDEGRASASPVVLRGACRLSDVQPEMIGEALAELEGARLVALYGDALFLPCWPEVIGARQYAAVSRFPLPPPAMLDASPDYRRFLAHISTGGKPGAGQGERQRDRHKEARHKCLWPSEWPKDHRDWLAAVERDQRKWLESANSTRTATVRGNAGGTGGEQVGNKGGGSNSLRGPRMLRDPHLRASASQVLAPAPGESEDAPPPNVGDNSPGGDAGNLAARPRERAGRSRAGEQQEEGDGVNLSDAQLLALRKVPDGGRSSWMHGIADDIDEALQDRLSAASEKIQAAGKSPARVQEALGYGHGRLRAGHVSAIVAAAEVLSIVTRGSG